MTFPGLTVRSVEEHQRVVADLITARPAGAAAAWRRAEGLVLAADVVAAAVAAGFRQLGDGRVRGAWPSTSPRRTPRTPVKLPVAEDIPAGRTDCSAAGARHRAPDHDGRAAAGGCRPPWCRSSPPTAGTAAPWQIRAAAKPGQHIRRAGEDVTAGTTGAACRSGRSRPAALGLAAALGLGRAARCCRASACW